MRTLESDWTRSDVPSGGGAAPAPAPAASGGGGTWGSITGTISAQVDLQAALTAKLSILDNSAAYGVNAVRIPGTYAAISAGDVTATSMATLNSGNAAHPNGAGCSIDLLAFGGGGWFGNLSAYNRIQIHSYGTVTGWEFNDNPYVLNNVLYHAGNLASAPEVTGTISATMGASLLKGQPVVLDPTTGKFLLADSATKPTSLVAGLLSANANSGTTGSALSKTFTLADWTAITGSVLLTPGANYFLQLGGGLGISPTGVCVVLIGMAVTTTTLSLNIKSPILL